jgi:hypothetical protein
MRRLASVLFGFAALAAIVFVGPGCDRQNVLRITDINEGRMISADLADFGVYTDPTDPEAEPVLIQQTTGFSVPVELQYVEIGSGLPTWTPYQATVHTARVTYKNAAGEPRGQYTYAVNHAVVADREGKERHVAQFPLVPSEWLIEQYGDEIAGDPEDIDIVETVEGILKITAVDSMTGREFEASANFSVEVGNFYDDPSSIGN